MRLAPITVLFGANSSGKSSIIQLLLMLKQTASSPDPLQVLDLGGDRNSIVDLGTLSDVLHGHQAGNALSFHLGWKPQAPLRFTPRGPVYQGQISLDSTVYAEQPAARPALREFEYRAPPSKVGLARVEKTGKYQLTTQGVNINRPAGRPTHFDEPFKCYGFPQDVWSYAGDAFALFRIQQAFEAQLGEIGYLGPLREPAKPEYLWGGGQPSDVGQRGEFAVHALLASSSKGRSRKTKTSTGTVETRVAQQLKNLGLIEGFRTEPIEAGGKLFRVQVIVKGGTTEVLLTAVGFGLSQVLPVITLLNYAEPGSTVILEQPEIHLHPSVQSSLADAIIAAVKTRSIQVIVESHSEHLLRRLQRRVAEGPETASGLRPKDLAVYFCSLENGESHLEELTVNEYGGITNWPRDFFGDPMEDLGASLEAEMKRRGIS